MIIINNFEILNNGSQLAIDVETNIGFNISSILLWNIDTFKDYSLAINITDQLAQINNKEILIIEATDVNISSFNDIYFMEVDSTYTSEEECTTCLDPALGITYNLSSYYTCLMNYLLENSLDCDSCKDKGFSNTAITISLLLDTIENGLELGYYVQAIASLKKVKKLCSFNKCKNCEQVECLSCSKFKQFKV